MNETVLRYGEWALIAGAAEGIGAAFSVILAESGMNLILIDKNLLSLDLLADELVKNHGITTKRIECDLSGENAAQSCLGKVRDIDFRLLIYVPAFSRVGKFVEYSEEEIGRFVSLNIAAPLHLVHSFLTRRQKGQQYGVILMSSLAGIIGPALAAPYAGTKAFTRIFSESLFYELRNDKVDVLACCAGPTSTPTFRESRPRNRSRIIALMEAEDVAAYSIKMLGKKPFCIPGWKNRFFYFLLTRMIPRKLAGKLVSRSMVKMYRDR